MKDYLLIKEDAQELIIRIKSIKQFAINNQSVYVTFEQKDGINKLNYFPADKFTLIDLHKITKWIELRFKKLNGDANNGTN